VDDRRVSIGAWSDQLRHSCVAMWLLQLVTNSHRVESHEAGLGLVSANMGTLPLRHVESLNGSRRHQTNRCIFAEEWKI